MAEQKDMTLRDVMLEAVEAQRLIDEGISAKASVSAHLMQVAAKFQKNNAIGHVVEDDKGKFVELELPKKKADRAKVLKAAADCATDFASAAEREENWIKSEEAGKDQYTDKAGNPIVPKAWSQAKSNIKSAIAAGIPVGDYDTESALRKASAVHRKNMRQKEENPKRISHYAKEGADLDAGEVLDNLPDDVRHILTAIAGHYSRLHGTVANLGSAEKRGFQQQEETLTAGLAEFAEKVERQEEKAREALAQLVKGKPVAKGKAKAETEKAGVEQHD